MTTPTKIEKLSPTQLKSYVRRGIITVMSDTATIPTRIEDTPEYQRYIHLKKKKIGVAEAARKYDVAHSNISRWKDKKFIPVLGHDGAQKILLDESYVAYCVHVYKEYGGHGKTTFNPDGTPFIPKTARA